MNKESALLLHAAASGGPLLPLAGLLAETHRVVRIGLLPDARLPAKQLDSLLAQGAATHLVAHGHAAPAALRLAQAHPDGIASVALIEPLQSRQEACALPFGLCQPVCMVDRILSGLQVHAEMRRLNNVLSNVEQHFFIDDPADACATDAGIADLIATFMSRYGGSHSPAYPSLPAARSLAA
jgi:pimeloyl-ACP methyl ester carboxylesterase